MVYQFLHFQDQKTPFYISTIEASGDNSDVRKVTYPTPYLYHNKFDERTKTFYHALRSAIINKDDILSVATLNAQTIARADHVLGLNRKRFRYIEDADVISAEDLDRDFNFQPIYKVAFPSRRSNTLFKYLGKYGSAADFKHLLQWGNKVCMDTYLRSDRTPDLPDWPKKMIFYRYQEADDNETPALRRITVGTPRPMGNFVYDADMDRFYIHSLKDEVCLHAANVYGFDTSGDLIPTPVREPAPIDLDQYEVSTEEDPDEEDPDSVTISAAPSQAACSSGSSSTVTASAPICEVVLRNVKRKFALLENSTFEIPLSGGNNDTMMEYDVVNGSVVYDVERNVLTIAAKKQRVSSNNK